MNRSKNRMLSLLAVLIIIFLALALYLAYFELFKAQSLRQNSLNMRNWVDESKFGRGRFLDRNGEVLVESEKKKDGKYKRYSNYPYYYSHIIGYNSVKYGKSGLEKILNKDLLNLGQDNAIAELRGKVLNPGRGNDVRLTIDNRLQKKAYNLIKKSKGAIVCLNPKTGEIYSMVSAPSFSVENLDSDWENLVQNTEGVFVNRAIKGIYPPGSTIKVISAISILRSAIDTQYNDRGKTTVEGRVYKNSTHKGNGRIGLEKALIKSSNVYFVDKAIEAGPGVFKEVFSEFGFNKKIPFELDVRTSKAEFTYGMDKNAFASQSFGQGNMLVTPLHLAMSYGAIANHGKMMKPYILKEILSPSGSAIKKNEQGIFSSTDQRNSETICEYLRSCAISYRTDSISGVKMAGKTGTAETANNTSHAWFAGYAPYNDPDFVVVVVLEEDGRLAIKAAMPMAAKLVNYWFSIKN